MKSDRMETYIKMRCRRVTSGWDPGRLRLGGLELEFIVTAYSWTDYLSPAGTKRTSLKIIGTLPTITRILAAIRTATSCRKEGMRVYVRRSGR